MSAERRVPSPRAVVTYVLRRNGYRVYRLVAGSRARRRPVPDGPALFVYGHSYAAIEGAKGPVWPDVVGEGLGLPVVNRAVGGDVVRDTVRRARIQRGRPGPDDLVLVHIGGNDVMRQGHDPRLPDRYRAALTRIVDRLGRDGATVRVLAEVPLHAWATMVRGFEHGSDEASAAVNAVARSFPGSIDLRPGWDPATMLLDDGIHPNELGVATLARTILTALQAEA